MPRAMVSEELAAYLLKNKDGIAEQFAAVVRLDPRIQTADTLPKEEVLDHIPALLESLAIELTLPEAASHDCPTVENARAHGLHRWQQHYRLDEILREYALLRQVIMFRIVQFEKVQLFEPEDRHSAARTLHDLIDEVMIVSTSEFARHIQESGSLQDPESPDPTLPRNEPPAAPP